MFFGARVMIRHIFGGPVPDSPEFDTDHVVGDDALQVARDRARQGDWQTARKVVEDAGDDWELRGRRISVLSDTAAKDDRWLFGWLSNAPSDPAAVLIQAAMLSQRAGEARGGASAAQTSAEQFQNFHELAAAAAQVGRRAMALAGPNDPVPWVETLGTMHADRRAYATSFDEIYAEGRRRDPFNFDLHLTALSLSCQKWYGSHEKMFGLAREVAAAAPPGAGAVLLPLHAHFEYVLKEFTWEAEDGKELKLAKRYFQRPEVQRELDQWIAKWRAGAPRPARIGTCRQWLALYFCLTGRRKEAKAEFDALGVHVKAVPAWSWFYGGSEYGYLRSWWWANGV